MEFFGLTNYGLQNYIKDAVREDYCEPKCKEDTRNLLMKIGDTECKTSIRRPATDRIITIDCYIGRVDGFSYGSLERFVAMKKKGVIKPVGPFDMYRLTPVTSNEISWWLCDSALENADWTITSPRFPAPVSPNTKILDIARRCNKYATF